MNRVAVWTLASCLVAPLTAYACIHAIDLLTGASLGSGKWSDRGVYVVAALLLKIQHVFLTKLQFERRARRQGCLPASKYPHKDPILGLDFFIKAKRAIEESNLLHFMAANHKNVGSTHWVLALGRPILYTDDPENIKSVLATNFDSWLIKGPRQDSVMPILGPQSVFTSNGEAWHRARSMIRPSFVRDQVADLACFDRHITNLVNSIRDRCDNGRAVFDIQELFFRLTMDSSTDFLLGRSTDLLLGSSDEAVEFLESFEHAIFMGVNKSRFGPILGSIPDAKLDAECKKARAFVRRYVAKAMSEKGNKERSYLFLHEMVDSGADEEYISDQVMSIILAGRDTTAATLAAIFYFLSQSPRIVQKLRDEMRDVGEQNPSWETLRNMKYLQNVIKEALRLAPPVSTNSRSCDKETILPRGGGPDGRSPVLVPKGTSCRWSNFSLHRRKDIYGPDAEEFRPERWETLRVGWEYTPFSGGPRVCIGQQFALTQLSLTTFRLLQNFETIEPRNTGPLKFKISATISLESPGCLLSMRPVA